MFGLSVNLKERLSEAKEQLYYQKNSRFAMDYSIHSTEVLSEQATMISSSSTPNFIYLFDEFRKEEFYAANTSEIIS